MPKLPGVPHAQAIRALEKLGYHVLREGKHVVMTDGERLIVVPRNTPINAFTMGSIVVATGLTVEQFRKLL